MPPKQGTPSTTFEIGMPEIRKRYLVAAFGSLFAVAFLIAVVLRSSHHSWIVSIPVAVWWSACLQLVAWGVAQVVAPDRTYRFREKLRAADSSRVGAAARAIDERFGFEGGPRNGSYLRARVLGAVIAIGLIVLALALGWFMLWLDARFPTHT